MQFVATVAVEFVLQVAEVCCCTFYGTHCTVLHIIKTQLVVLELLINIRTRGICQGVGGCQMWIFFPFFLGLSSSWVEPDGCSSSRSSSNNNRQQQQQQQQCCSRLCREGAEASDRLIAGKQNPNQAFVCSGFISVFPNLGSLLLFVRVGWGGGRGGEGRGGGATVYWSNLHALSSPTLNRISSSLSLHYSEISI